MSFFNPLFIFKGFEARGTVIGKRLKTTQNLLATINRGTLVTNPNDLLEKKRFRKQFHKKKSRRPSRQQRQAEESEVFGVVKKVENVTYDDHSLAYGKLTTSIDTEKMFEESFEERKKLESLIHIKPTKFFCDVPRKEFTNFVVQRSVGGPNSTDSLFDVDAFYAICQLDETIRSVSYFTEFCEREYNSENCCRSWSIPNYVSLLANKSSCFNITQEDVDAVHNLLVKCYPYFRRETNECAFTYDNDGNCLNDAPKECLRESAVYGILQFLTDNEFQVSFVVRYLFIIVFLRIPNNLLAEQALSHSCGLLKYSLSEG